MDKSVMVLCGTAASIAFIHTILGPDHYLPFVVMSRARRWSVSKTAWVTLLCGLGHVLSSVVLGLVGVFVGMKVLELEAFEGLRGTFAAWLLIGFGFAYLVWGVHHAVRKRSHRHAHYHEDGTVHDHTHSHSADHTHVHDSGGRDITPWFLFMIFVLGPCEPLIPILMYPAANSGIGSTFLVAGVFSVVTIATMLAIVALSTWGVRFANLGRFERYGHAVAGAMICLSGLAVQLLGL
jgi:nickel/cobalt exporter